MPTTEQILNKSATIYGQVGKSLQILNKRDKLKGADNAYLSVSNLDSIDSFINIDTVYDVFHINTSVRPYILYNLRVRRVFIHKDTKKIDTYGFNHSGYDGGALNAIVVDESDDVLLVNTATFPNILWDNKAGVKLDIGREISGSTASFVLGSTSSDRKLPNGAVINWRKKPTSVIAATAFNNQTNNIIINVSWREDDPINVNAPWGATNATIHYNVVVFPELED